MQKILGRCAAAIVVAATLLATGSIVSVGQLQAQDAVPTLLAPKPTDSQAPAADTAPTAGPNLETYLDDALLAMVYPDADRVGPVEGEPPAAAVYKGDDLVGYVFEQYDVVQGVGYSKRPFHMVIGLDLSGHLTGARLAMHVEPIAILGRTDDDFHKYVEQFAGIDIRRGVSVMLDLSGSALEGDKFAMRGSAGDVSKLTPVDAVSRTTTSSILFSDSIVRSARIIARTRGIALDARDLGQRLDMESFTPMPWVALIDDGALAHLRLTIADVAAAFAALPDDAKAPRKVRLSPDDEIFVDLYAAVISPAGIGVNLLGRTWYDQYISGRNIEDVILFVATKGTYRFHGDDPADAAQFSRLRLFQGDTEIAFGPSLMKTLPFHHATEAPDLDEIGLFFFSGDAALDPTRPWRLELAVDGDGDTPAQAIFPVDYTLPERFILAQPEVESPIDAATDAMVADDASIGIDWRQSWTNQSRNIVLLLVTLGVLVVLLSLQDQIARRRRLHRWLRIGFLAWILIWLGWYAGAQVTVINLLNIAQSIVFDFDWAFFMVEPLIFIITAFVALGLFFWGRAIFCGWLCPFGALQELLNNIATALRVPQWRIPEGLHQRAIAIKYVAVLALLGLTFYSFDLAIMGSNIEPFKAAIIFRFDAPLAAVAYAMILLVCGLFVERAYCRFLCPLGAGLAILGRVRMFNWLKRRPECGNPCRRCERVCPTGAIGRSGAIDMNECFYCLDCQVTYYDSHECPPLAARRKSDRAPLQGAPVPAAAE